MSPGRICTAVGRSSKPTVIIDKHLKIWLGNPTDQEQVYTGEIFGFNTGNFEYKICRQKRDVSGVAWRLVSDCDLVVVDKQAIALCKYLHQLATQNGLGDVSVLEHDLEPKLHAAASWFFSL